MWHSHTHISIPSKHPISRAIHTKRQTGTARTTDERPWLVGVVVVVVVAVLAALDIYIYMVDTCAAYSVNAK